MNAIVIKGAYYYDKEQDRILIPRFTGEYIIVDCDIYYPKKKSIEEVGRLFFEMHKEEFIKLKEKKYYYAYYAPCYVGDNWELLSDLSELVHVEQLFDWNEYES